MPRIPTSVYVEEPGGLCCHRLLAQLAGTAAYERLFGAAVIDEFWHASPAKTKERWVDWFLSQIR